MATTWHLIVPKGEFPHPSGVVQVIDDAAVSAMAASFDPRRKVLVDFDHYSDLTNAQREKVKEAGVQLPSEAAGWVTAVKATEAGLMGQLERTPAGETAISNAAYRFLSPVWKRRDCEKLDGDRVRPTVLCKVGLTNEPNIQAIPELVANRGQERLIGPMVDFVANREQENSMDYKSKLCNALNLDPEKATDAEIEAAEAAMIEKRKSESASATEMANRITALEAERDTMKNRAESAESKVAEHSAALLKGKVEAALKDHEAVISNRADIEAALTRDFDGTIRTLKALKIDALPNRRDGELPEGKDANFDSKVRSQREAVESYVNRNPGVSRSTAFEILRVQGHEAFK